MIISECLCFKSPHLLDQAEKDFLNGHSQNPQEIVRLGDHPSTLRSFCSEGPFSAWYWTWAHTFRLDLKSQNYCLWWPWKLDVSAVILNKKWNRQSLTFYLLSSKVKRTWWLTWRCHSPCLRETVPEKAPLTHAFFDLGGNCVSSLKCSGNHTNTAWAFARGTGISSSRVALWEKTGLK